MTEADTCRRFITPALQAAGWDIHEQIAEQRTFTDGRIIPSPRAPRRRPGKRADYILRFTRDVPLAVVEAKAWDVPAGDGLQQAIEYAQILDLPFAYAANGRSIIEFDRLTGHQEELKTFPSPDELWSRQRHARDLSEEVTEVVLTPSRQEPGLSARYYQTTAINRAVEAIAGGRERVLLTLATGTGKSYIAFQICWRLWRAKWTRRSTGRRPRMLYLADRNVLIDQPMLQTFAAFGDAAHRIRGRAVKSREMYFATYQQIAEDERRPGLYREYDPNFFDLVIVDECHRGSARDDSTWREILDYFTGASKLGMTATPLRNETRDTYEYFGNPLVQYSLAQGIDDGFLAPYRVRRIVTDIDATGWRPERGQRDRFGTAIPDELYETADFDKTLVLAARTEAIAAYLIRYLEVSDPEAKTIVFCADQEHAQLMRDAIARLSPEQMRADPNYVVRITSDEGDVGRAQLDQFKDIDQPTPVIVTTSELLSTGVDMPTVKNIALCRTVNSLSEFKQIIGRGTRLRTDYGKWYFTILDFTGSATRSFADPEFDGFPASILEDYVDSEPTVDEGDGLDAPDVETVVEEEAVPVVLDLDEGPLTASGGRKYYVDEGVVEIVADLAYELDAEGKRLRTVALTDYAGEKIRSLYRSAAELRAHWIDPGFRDEVLAELAERGIDVTELAARSGHSDADPFDLLCHVAYNAPVLSRSQRAQRLKAESAFWERYGPQARDVLEAILDRYADGGVREFELPTVLELPPLDSFGNVIEISERFGGAEELRDAVTSLQQELYAS